MADAELHILKLERDFGDIEALARALSDRLAALEQGVLHGVRARQAPTVVVTADVNPSSGGAVVFTATIAPLAGLFEATGSVRFFVDGTLLDTQPLADDGTSTMTAKCSTTDSGLTAAGSYTIRADYSGDSSYLPASGTMTQVVSTGNSTFSGTAVGGGGLGLPFAGVVIKDYTTPTTVYWSGTADSVGFFSGSATIPSSPTTIIIETSVSASDPWIARFSGASFSGTNSLFFGFWDLRTVGSPPEASGYKYSKYAYFPLKTTLHISDDTGLYPAMTLTYGTPGWTGSAQGNYPGCGACAAQNGTVHLYSLRASTDIHQYKCIGFGNTCPNVNGLTNQLDVTMPLSMTSTSPITISGSLTTTGSKWYCGATVTWTVTE